MTSPVATRPGPAWQPPAALTSLAWAGPVASVYLDTTGAVADAANRVRLGWKNLRRQLEEDGAPQAALQALDGCMDGAHVPGETLAAFATEAGLLDVQHLLDPPATTVAVLGPLPHLVPLLAARQREVPLVVVATDRLGADLLAVLPDAADVQHAVQGEELHVTRSAPGGWSQRRFQQRAENRWDANSREVAEALTRLVDGTGARLVVATGDVRAMQFLRSGLPARVAALLVEVQGDYSSVDNAAEQAGALAAEAAARDTEEVLGDYAGELGQGDKACAGAVATLAALAAGQAEEVLIDHTRTRGRPAWFAADPMQVAGDGQTLTAAGATDAQQALLDDVLICAAAASGATVRIAPAGAAQLDPAGVGALLRYPT